MQNAPGSSYRGGAPCSCLMQCRNSVPHHAARNLVESFAFGAPGVGGGHRHRGDCAPRSGRGFLIGQARPGLVSACFACAWRELGRWVGGTWPGTRPDPAWSMDPEFPIPYGPEPLGSRPIFAKQNMTCWPKTWSTQNSCHFSTLQFCRL